MIKKLFVCFLMFCTTASYGQNNLWKKIEAPTKNDIYVRAFTQKGSIVGVNEHFKKKLISKDKGLTWDTLPYSSIGFNIYEDKLGNVYSIENQYVIKIGGTLALDTLATLNYTIQSFLPLDDKRFLFGYGNYLYLKNSTATKPDSVKSEIEILDIREYSGDTCVAMGIYRIGADKFIHIQKFLKDLKWIGKSVSTGQVYVKTRSFAVSNKRIFINNTYTDNFGLGWTNFMKYKIQDSLITVVGNNNTIYHTHADTLFISTNNGTNFSSKKLNIQCDFLASDENANLIIGTNSDYCSFFTLGNAIVFNNPYYISKDKGNTFVEIKSPYSLPFVNDFSAGKNERLVLNHCLKGYIKANNTSDWKLSEYIYLKSLNNNSLYAYDFLNQYNVLSYNDGATWERNEEDTDATLFQYIVEKETVLAKFSSNGSFKYSLDSGKVWFGPISSDPFFNNHTISNDLNLYNKSSLTRYDLFSGNYFVVNLKKDNNTYSTALQTSYSGNILYGARFINENGERNVKFYRSYDKGNTFEELQTFKNVEYTIGLYIRTDRFDNVYLFIGNKIYMSSDKGNTWSDITPNEFNIISISQVDVSTDNYLYIGAIGEGILKYRYPLTNPKLLKISIINDENKNCKKDAGEKGIRGIKVNVGKQYFSESDENGKVNLSLLNGTYPVSIQFNPDLYEDCSGSFTADFSTGKDTLELDFLLKVKKQCADPQISFSLPFLRRCFSNIYKSTIVNRGTADAVNTQINLTLDTLMEFEGSSLPILAQSGGKITLNAGTLKQGEALPFTFTAKVSCTAPLGQEHCVKGKVSTTNSCYSLSEYSDCQKNIGSYDPNDKVLYTNGIRGKSSIQKGDKIEYLIRFQNTGTDTAFTVRVEDPISSKFDISSIKPIASSHPYTWKVDRRKLIVEFKNINLVDSFRNEALSHGFIKFEIKLDSATQIGEKIENEAYIYFDFNDAIQTNKVSVNYGLPDRIKEVESQSLMLSPNPTTGTIRIEGVETGEKSQIRVTDILGREVLSNSLTTNEIDLNRFPSGVYFIQVNSEGRKYLGKVVKE